MATKTVDGIASWVEAEMATVDLNDARRDRRLNLVITQLSQAPAVSIPSACVGRAETEAAYRLFENEAIDFQAILESHRDSTLERIRQNSVCLLAQDTTELDLSRPHQQVKGAGPMDAGPRRGCFLHPTIALTEDGIPLGTVDARIWARDEQPAVKVRENKTEKRKRQRATPLEAKESFRWLEGMQVAHWVAGECPETQVIAVSDSESDIFELFLEGQHPGIGSEAGESTEPRAEWIVRAGQDRVVTRPETEGATICRSLFAEVAASPLVCQYEIEVRGRDAKVNCETRARRQPRASRTGTVEVRACRITICRPQASRAAIKHVAVNAVLVQEVNPPPGDEAVCWLLLTSLPIDTEANIQQVISLYCLRWQIEIFFRVIKQGCRAEYRLFETLGNFSRYLGVALIVGWRTLWLSRLSRDTPDVSCEVAFEVAEWKSVFQVIQQKPAPQTPPSLGKMVRMVAQLGGYTNRRKEAYPGPETIWKGLLRMTDLAIAWNTFGPDSRK
jgi:hypothetical protein